MIRNLILGIVASIVLAGAAIATAPSELTLPNSGLRAADTGGAGTGPFVMQTGGGQAVSQSVTISSGTSLSPAVDLGTTRLFGIVMPASWTAANLTFQGSVDCSTYSNLYDDGGSEVTVTAAASQMIVISSPAKWLGVRCIKVRSGTNGTPVNQGADRALTIVSVP